MFIHRVILLCKSEIRTKDCPVGGMYCQLLFSNYITPRVKEKEKNDTILSVFEVTVYFKIDPFDRVRSYYVMFSFYSLFPCVLFFFQ